MRVAIVLAAGSARRFGRGDKLLAPLHGRPLLAHAIAAARSSGAGRLLVVVPSLGGRVGRFVGPQIGRVVAHRHRDGMGASLAVALRAVRPIERELLIFLADMPFARAPRMTLRPGSDALRPCVGGKPGHPMLVRTSAARAARPVGDRGLAGVRRLAAVAGKPANLLDVDTLAALRRARRMPKLI